jgi:muramoyltetrapeptide carboxypeptidase
LIWDRAALCRSGYLAGSDHRRLTELQAAINDPTARAVVAARGGYGASRIGHQADYSALQAHPKWFVGFSDITALHLELNRQGLCSLHASNVTGLGRADAVARQLWVDALEHPAQERQWSALESLSPGTASGVLAGGNLSLVVAAATAGRLKLPRQCILFIEEVNEAPYRLDRMLTSLVLGGHLNHVVGVCVGQLLGCAPREQVAPAHQAIASALGPLNVPILYGLPVGHSLPNEPLPLGRVAHLSSSSNAVVIAAATDE